MKCKDVPFGEYCRQKKECRVSGSDDECPSLDSEGKKPDLYELDEKLYYSVPCISCKHRDRTFKHCAPCVHYA